MFSLTICIVCPSLTGLKLEQEKTALTLKIYREGKKERGRERKREIELITYIKQCSG